MARLGQLPPEGKLSSISQSHTCFVRMCAMSRSFDIFTESPASVEQIHAAFGREDYWLARLEPARAHTTLDSLIVDDDGTVTACMTQHLGRQLLGPVGKLIPGDLKIVQSETWRPVGDGQVRGQVNISASPGLGSGRAEAWLEPSGDGSQMRFLVRVEVKIPLLGRKIEKSMAADLAESINALQRFTTTWIAEHA
jgi:Protein of unknown function (DUF2505)